MDLVAEMNWELYVRCSGGRLKGEMEGGGGEMEGEERGGRGREGRKERKERGGGA